MSQEIRTVNQFVASRIRAIRISQGLNLKQLSLLCGIPVGSLCCLESAHYRLNLENLFRLLHALGADLSMVWPGKIDRPAGIVDDAYVHRVVEQAEANLPRPVGLGDILQAVCSVFSVREEELSSPSRERHLTDARTCAAHLALEQPHLSMAEMARRLKRTDSALSHALKRRKPFRGQFEIALRSARQQLQQRGGIS